MSCLVMWKPVRTRNWYFELRANSFCLIELELVNKLRETKLTITSGKFDTSSFDPCPVTQRPNISPLYLILSNYFTPMIFPSFYCLLFSKNFLLAFVCREQLWKFILPSGTFKSTKNIQAQRHFTCVLNHNRTCSQLSNKRLKSRKHCVIVTNSSFLHDVVNNLKSLFYQKSFVLFINCCNSIFLFTIKQVGSW